jgi:hypothetical protein
MTKEELLWVEANMTGKFSAKHYVNEDTKTRYMEYKGIVFHWDADREVWDFDDYFCNVGKE